MAKSVPVWCLIPWSSLVVVLELMKCGCQTVSPVITTRTKGTTSHVMRFASVTQMIVTTYQTMYRIMDA